MLTEAEYQQQLWKMDIHRYEVLKSMIERRKEGSGYISAEHSVTVLQAVNRIATKYPAAKLERVPARFSIDRRVFTGYVNREAVEEWKDGKYVDVHSLSECRFIGW